MRLVSIKLDVSPLEARDDYAGVVRKSWWR